MVEKADVKAETLLNLDDLLQCPVCYEIPLGQIFQCNEGHHVCGRCKMRLDVCPVCRALFFGTRNYAMEELIANFRKLRALKSNKKSNMGHGSDSTTVRDATLTTLGENVSDENDEEASVATIFQTMTESAPQACKGLFRCLCCKNGSGERLPAARLLNHLRYFHSPDLIEGRSENGEYMQVWQFGTAPGKLVTAIRVADMGIFFLTIEIYNHTVRAWLSMAASPWVTQVFNYTLTLCGNDREAIFSDSVYSVRSCEGTLRKNGHCLVIKEADARPLIAPAVISGKLSIRRTPHDQPLTFDTPRVVMRIANRCNVRNNRNNQTNQSNTNEINHTNHDNYDLEPFLQELQNDVARLSRAFANINREAAAYTRSDTALASILNLSEPTEADRALAEPQPVENQNQNQRNGYNMSRNARRRMRLRLRSALNAMAEPEVPNQSVENDQRPNGYVAQVPVEVPPAPVTPSVQPPSSSSGPSQPQTSNGGRNKKKRRLRR